MTKLQKMSESTLFPSQFGTNLYNVSAAEGISFSGLLQQALDANQDARLLPETLDKFVKFSIPTVMESILSRLKTQQVKELQQLNRRMKELNEKYKLMSNGKYQMIWLLGHLSTLLDLISYLDDTLELDVDERLIRVMDNGNAIRILNKLNDIPRISYFEQVKEFGLTMPMLPEILNKMEEYGLIFVDEYGEEKYYTLSAKGKKLYNYFKLQNASITPDVFTTYVEQLLISLKQILQRTKSPNEVIEQFRRLARKHATNSPRLQYMMQDVIKSMLRNSNNISSKTNRIHLEYKETYNQGQRKISLECEFSSDNNGRDNNISAIPDRRRENPCYELPDEIIIFQNTIWKMPMFPGFRAYGNHHYSAFYHSSRKE